jgi:TetR/AcrR family transcriptional regulator, transcriptional repressor for nem operon
MSQTNTKDRLVETAIEMVWKNSYSSVSVDDICKAADIRKGSFYHCFKSKADLAIAAMEQHYQNSKGDFDNVFSPENSPIERFKRLADLAYEKQRIAAEKYGHVCGCPFASLGSEMASQDNLIRKQADKVFRRYLRYYESTIRDLVAEGLLPDDTDITARAEEVTSYICGQVMMARVQNSLEPLKRDLKVGLFRLLGVDSEALETS